jgi:hypothetical protein
MIKKSYLLVSFAIFSYIFINYDVMAAQNASDYEISAKENATDKSTKAPQLKMIKKKKTVKPTEVDQTETLFSIKGAIKDAGYVAKDGAQKVGNTVKKGAEKGADLAKKGVKQIKKGTEKGVDLIKKGAKGVKESAQAMFSMSANLARKVPWTIVFKEGLKIAIPTFKGCVKGGIVAGIPALMAGPETLGLGTIGTLAGACAIGGAKASIPAILGVSKDAYNAWSNKKKADEIQKQIDLNQQDANAVSATISKANTVKASLKSKDEKEAADVAISKAKDTQAAINNFVTTLKTEQKKHK